MKIEQHNKTLFFEIEKSIKSYRRFAQNNINKAGYTITIDQLLLLMQISHKPDISQVELSDRIFKNEASVTRIIELLVKQGFLSRKEDQKDRRKKVLRLTINGKKLLLKLSPIIDDNRRKALRNISQQEIEGASKLLSKISTNCQD